MSFGSQDQPPWMFCHQVCGLGETMSRAMVLIPAEIALMKVISTRVRATAGFFGVHGFSVEDVAATAAVLSLLAGICRARSISRAGHATRSATRTRRVRFTDHSSPPRRARPGTG